MDRRGRARSFRRVASLGAEIETAGSAAVKNIIMIDRPYACHAGYGHGPGSDDRAANFT